MNRTIFLLRHGQTIWNKESRFQGRLDSPLTEVGLAQAESVGELLKQLIGDHSVSGFYSSPIGRAKKTAEIIAGKLGLACDQIQYCADLMELDFGRWGGMTADEIRQSYPDEFEKRENDKWNFVCPDGESYAGLVPRVEKLLNELPVHGNVVLVAHGMINRVIRGLLLNLPGDQALQFDQPNNGVVKITNECEEIFTA